MKTLMVFVVGLLCGALALGVYVATRPAPDALPAEAPALELPMPTGEAPPLAQHLAPRAPGAAPTLAGDDVPPASPVHEWTRPSDPASAPSLPAAVIEPGAAEPAAIPAVPPVAGTVRTPLDMPALDEPVAADPATATATTTAPAPMPSRKLQLRVPVEGVLPAQLSDTFTDARGEGRSHDAIDIMAATGTPVLAVEDGRIVKLFDSKPGGLTIYQFDRNEELAYYYAHLDRYAPGLAEGRQVRQGEVIGYVGFTGNASPEAPHLHFAIFLLEPGKQWWRGAAINPYPWLRGR